MLSVGKKLLLCCWLCWGLSGCISKVTVSATADTGSNVEYTYVTITGLWLHKHADAVASDSGWKGETLDSPVTVDLATLNSGELETLVSKLNLDPGTYRAMRLKLADNSADLTSEADDAGLSYNNQIQYLNSSGSLTTLPLELADPSGNLILPVNITIASGSSGKALLDGLSGSSSSYVTTITLDINAIRGITYFDYDGQAGALFNPTLNAYNNDATGAITGSLDLSAVAYANRTSAQGVVITAEGLSADGTRYVETKSVTLSSSGDFTLSPLPADSDTTIYYDLVIHGQGIQPMVIASVPVDAGDTTTVQSDDLTLSLASTYSVNTAGAQSGIPANTQIRFYQTLPDDPLPHLIEFNTLNPYSSTFSEDLALPISSVVFGYYNDGDDISFSTVTPEEGSGTYQVVTSAPLHDASTLATVTVASSTADSSVTISTLPNMDFDGNGSAASISGTITLSTIGYYDAGFVQITHGGQLIDVVSLDDALAATGSSGYADFTVSNLPGNANTSKYNVSVRLWNSANPSNTLTRVASDTAVDLTGGNVTGVTLTVP